MQALQQVSDQRHVKKRSRKIRLQSGKAIFELTVFAVLGVVAVVAAIAFLNPNGPGLTLGSVSTSKDVSLALGPITLQPLPILTQASGGAKTTRDPAIVKGFLRGSLFKLGKSVPDARSCTAVLVNNGGIATVVGPYNYEFDPASPDFELSPCTDGFPAFIQDKSNRAFMRSEDGDFLVATYFPAFKKGAVSFPYVVGTFSVPAAVVQGGGGPVVIPPPPPPPPGWIDDEDILLPGPEDTFDKDLIEVGTEIVDENIDLVPDDIHAGYDWQDQDDGYFGGETEDRFPQLDDPNVFDPNFDRPIDFPVIDDPHLRPPLGFDPNDPNFEVPQNPQEPIYPQGPVPVSDGEIEDWQNQDQFVNLPNNNVDIVIGPQFGPQFDPILGGSRYDGGSSLIGARPDTQARRLLEQNGQLNQPQLELNPGFNPPAANPGIQVPAL